MWKRSFHSPLEFIAFTFWFPVLKNPASSFLQSLILFVTPQTKLQIFQALGSLIIFAVISIASLSFVTDSAMAVPVVPNESSTIPFTTLDKGIYSSIIEQLYVVIKEEKEWDDLWNRHTTKKILKPDVPNVDFLKEMVAGIFTGQKSTGGYAVEIVNIVREKGVIKVLYTERIPLPDEVVTAVFTQPYHLIKMPKEDLEIIFHRITDR